MAAAEVVFSWLQTGLHFCLQVHTVYWNYARTRASDVDHYFSNYTRIPLKADILTSNRSLTMFYIKKI